MGEIADMHIAAYEAGLDPNEMDGHDWAEFYEAQGDPVTPQDLIDNVASEVRMLLNAIDDMQDSDEFDANQRGETLALYISEFGLEKAKLIVQLLVDLNETANAETDRLAEADQPTLIECPVCSRLCKGERGLFDHRKAKGH